MIQKKTTIKFRFSLGRAYRIGEQWENFREFWCSENKLLLNGCSSKYLSSCEQENMCENVDRFETIYTKEFAEISYKIH
jgi:hypothetical protein